MNRCQSETGTMLLPDEQVFYQGDGRNPMIGAIMVNNARGRCALSLAYPTVVGMDRDGMLRRKRSAWRNEK